MVEHRGGPALAVDGGSRGHWPGRSDGSGCRGRLQRGEGDRGDMTLAEAERVSPKASSAQEKPSSSPRSHRVGSKRVPRLRRPGHIPA